MKKSLSALLVLLTIVVVFAGCSPSDHSSEDVTGVSVHVTIAKDGLDILSAEVTVPGDKPTAADAVIQACKSKDMPYTYKDGMFDHFDGIDSTKTDGWLLYVDGDLSDVGAKDVPLQEDMLIIFSYDNYDEAFA